MIIKNSYKNTLYRTRTEFFVCLFLALIIAAVYFQVRNHDFINYDDGTYVTRNPNLNGGLTWEGIFWAFTSTRASNWHPMTWLSHMLDVHLYGMNPGGHHLTNVVFHVLNTLLLFLLLRRMTGDMWECAFLAALFALHPLHVESVAWVSERKDVLSALFWFVTLLCYVWYVERPGVARYLMILLFFIMGLMSKPMMVTLPFVLLLLDYWPLKRYRFCQSGCGDASIQGYSILHLVSEKTPFFALSCGSSVVTYIVQQSGGSVGSLNAIPFALRIENAMVSYAAYLGKMIWPVNLGVLYPYKQGLPWWQASGAFLLLLSIFLMAIKMARQCPYFIVGWLWYIGTLVPVIGFVQVGSQAMADRYTYVPLIGIFIIITWGASELVTRWIHGNAFLIIGAAALITILTVTTLRQIKFWDNSINLFEHTLDITENNYVAHNNLGIALSSRGKLKAGIMQFSKAVSINPRFAKAYNNMGAALAYQGRTSEANACFIQALKLNPDYVDAHKNLGISFMREGKREEAISHFREALRIMPGNMNIAKKLEKALALQETNSRARKSKSQ